MLLYRYQGKEGLVPAAYLQRYQGQGAGLASTGAQIVATMKEASDLTLNPTTATNPNSKPPKSLESLASPPPVSSPDSPSSPLSLSMTLNVSYSEAGHSSTVTTSTASSQKSSAVSTLASAMAGKTASHPARTPSPKPAPSVAVAAAAAAEKQKLAPTWHSSTKPPVEDKERKLPPN